MNMSFKLDIICITETWLDGSFILSGFLASKYIIIRHDRNRNGGGVLILIKTQMKPI